MTRYLTPSKISLLAVVSIYTEGVVPNSAIVPVLSFLVSHLLPIPPPPSSNPNPSTISSTTLTPQDKIHAIPITAFETATSSLPSSIPGRTVWDLLLKKLWNLDCSDALDEFFASVSSMLVKTREEQIADRNNGIAPQTGRMLLSRSSPLGAFVRRAQLEYTRLQFHDAVALWKGFVKYRLPTQLVWAKRNPLGSQAVVDVNLLELGLDLTSPLAEVVYGPLEEGGDVEVGMSTRDIERLLDFQVGEMQGNGCRITPEMRSRLEQMILSGVSIPSSQHYIKFLDSWKAGDYTSSFDHLHRYFDYTIQNRDRTFYQYALLNLAILQADFGCHGEAVLAMQESISIARETHDMNCLNFCMSWLYHFGKAFPDEMKDVQNTGMLGSEKEGLAFLQAKARETEMWSLLGTSLLSEAKLELQSGESVASAFEHIVKASFLNVTKDLPNSAGPQLMLQASAYIRIGVAHLAWSNCEVFRECYAKHAPFEDNLRVGCRSSLMLAAKGNYEQSIARLNEVSSDSLRVLKNQQSWTVFCGLLKLQRQLHRDDKLAAEHLIPQLHACAPPDAELAMTLSLLEVDYLMRKGDYTGALKIIEQNAQSIRQENFDVATQVKLLVVKARIFEQTQQPERGFSLAMRAASIAHRSRYLPGLWESIGVLSVILMTFKEFEAALEILESIVPQVLECEDAYLTARTYSLLVDASMGLAGQAQRDKVRQKEHMARAVEFIDCAFESYSNVEDVAGQCEMMAKKATVMHLSGDLVLANDYAAKYLDLKRQAAVERVHRPAESGLSQPAIPLVHKWESLLLTSSIIVFPLHLPSPLFTSLVLTATYPTTAPIYDYASIPPLNPTNTTSFFKSVAINNGFMSIENLKTFDPFAEADEDTGDTKQSQNYIHIRIQQRNGRKTLTTVQGLPKKFDQKKILKVIKKKFACNGTIVTDSEMGEVIQLQGDQRKDVQEFLVDKKEGLELDAKTIKVHGF